MAHQEDYKLTNEIIAKGMEAVPELMRILINNAMQVERTKYRKRRSMREQKSAKGTPTDTSQKQSGPG
jgi:putative transposase